MADIFSQTKRSEIMSHIKGRNTKPELAVRSLLHRLGYRFRLHRADLPGKPDIVLPRYKTVIFVHGCFWHRHKDCRLAYTPKSRTDFWLDKLESNVMRDIQAKSDLEAAGWRVIIIWQCEVRKENELSTRIITELSR